MKGFLKVGLLIAVAMALFGTYRFVSAQDETSFFGRVPVNAPTFHKKIRAKAPTFNKEVQDAEVQDAVTEHVLAETYLVIGNGGPSGTSVPAATLTPIDSPSTVVCPAIGTDTCTILANQFFQTTGSQTSNNFAICLYVDDNLIPNSCWFNNDTPNDGTFVQGTASNWETGVSPGSHTVQTFVLSNKGCLYGNYTFQYIVYQP